MTLRNRQIGARIENLGRLNDRRLQAVKTGNTQELAQVAMEYEGLRRPCMMMAKEIWIEISVMKQQKASEA